MRIALIGYQGSGKSTLFSWLTGLDADPALAHTTQTASVPVPDKRIEPLCEIYRPKKITLASLDLIDTPGLSRDHEGNAGRLAMIREAGCLVFVVGAFTGADATRDLQCFAEDLLLGDMEIVTGRISRLKESVKKPRPNREQELAELATLESILASMESGKPLRIEEMDEVQKKATRSFQLLTEKPRMTVINLADDAENHDGPAAEIPGQSNVAAVPAGLQYELSRMDEEERQDFINDLGVSAIDRGELLRQMLYASGQLIYFTAGEKEVRSWALRIGGTALEAAENVHSDLARGFIRAETMRYDDLIRLGSEREMKAQNLVRQEPKDYVVRDGDVINIKFSV